MLARSTQVTSLLKGTGRRMNKSAQIVEVSGIELCLTRVSRTTFAFEVQIPCNDDYWQTKRLSRFPKGFVGSRRSGLMYIMHGDDEGDGAVPGPQGSWKGGQV